MTIEYSDASKIFHLQTKHTSYVFHVLENGELGQIYYGTKIHAKDNYSNLTTRELKDATVAWKIDKPDFQPDILKFEYSALGSGDFRFPAFQLTFNNGSRISEFKYASYEIKSGKRRLDGLPATFGFADDGSQTLIITLRDETVGVDLQLSYSVFPDQDVIVRSSKFINHGTERVVIDHAFSSELDLPDSNYDLIEFPGAWARERHFTRSKLKPGYQGAGSLRTASSHQANPFMMLARPDTGENSGEVFGFNLVYSGNFLDQVEVDQFDGSRVLIGINPNEFSWNLTPGETFQTPEAVQTFSNQGINALSQQLADFYQQHLVNQRYAHSTRPILVNNWEATYFNFNENKLMEIVKTAKSVGIEMFVLDDGWFGERNDDTTSLGDWFVDKSKFPNGIGHFANQVHELGMKLGVWFEPEMISKQSQLYGEHPDWMIQTPGRHQTPGRNQFVLDMSRPEVVDYLVDSISKIIDETQLDYIKWDMNRYITEMYGQKLAANQQLEMGHRYILGVYDLYERLTKAHPEVLFESCASGGGRFDLGMMYYAPQAWTSDDTDAVERMKIQHGTSYGYSQSMMGAHVSAVPNDQTGRYTELNTRARVAYFGDFGYELDLTKMTDSELSEVRKQVEFYKKYREVFQFGKFYRLESPFNGNVTSWQVVSPDRDLAIVGRFQLLNIPNSPYLRIKFKGLDPDKQYRVNGSEEIFYGDELMNAGYFVPEILTNSKKQGLRTADFSSQLFIIKAV